MKFFTQTTTDHIVIMGRKNWDSIPHKFSPLPNRINAVVTKNMEYTNDKADVFTSVEEAIAFYQTEEYADKEIFIIGGGQIYKYSLENDLVDEMLVTMVDAEYEADTFFPDIDEEKWDGELIMEYEADEKNPHDFDIYRFVKKN